MALTQRRPPVEQVTVVVVTYRGASFLDDCLDGLAAQTMPHRLLVIDNASTDGSAALLARRLAPDQVLRLPENAGFAGGVAAALSRVRTPWVALLNDDAVAEPDWLDRLLAAARHDPAAAAWTCMILTADGSRVASLGGGLTDLGYGYDQGEGLPAAPAPAGGDVFAFCGGAVLLRVAAVRAVGGFPAEYFLYYEDTDTSWRLRLAGWEIRLVPQARVRHRQGASSEPGSAAFHRWNERNRLRTLIRCAPAAVVLTALARFALTTGKLALRRALRRPVPPGANHDPGLRLGVIGRTVADLPLLLRRRGAVGQLARRSRAEVWSTARRLSERNQGSADARS